MAITYLSGQRVQGSSVNSVAEYSQTVTTSQRDFSDVSGYRAFIESGNSLIGKTITSVTVYIGKATQSTSNGSGTLTVKFRDASASSYTTMGTLDTSTVTTTDKTARIFNDASFTIEANDWLEVEWGTGSVGGNSFRPAVYVDAAGDSDISGDQRIGNTSAGWTDDGSNQLAWIASSNTDDKTTVTDVPVGSQFEQTNDRKFYQLGTAYLGNTNDDDGANFDASDSLNDIIGDKITSGNSLIGKTITKISLKLYRVATGTATETLTFGIWDFATGDLKGTDFGTIQVDTIATSSTEYTLTHSGSGVELAENDIIGIRCDYEDATPTSHQIKVRQKDDPSSYANGGRIIFTQGDDNPSNFDEDKDIYFKAHFKDWVERGTAI